MAPVASDMKNGMVVEEMGAMAHTGPKSTSYDQRDMWRMGKIQELRVCHLRYVNHAHHADSHSAMVRSLGYTRLR